MSDGRQVFLGGLDDSLLGNPSVSDTLAYRQNYDYAITMTHEPDVADAFIGTDTQLVLAGHSHGGQVWIPFYPIKMFWLRSIHGAYTSLMPLHNYMSIQG